MVLILSIFNAGLSILFYPRTAFPICTTITTHTIIEHLTIHTVPQGQSLPCHCLYSPLFYLFYLVSLLSIVFMSISFFYNPVYVVCVCYGGCL